MADIQINRKLRRHLRHAPVVGISTATHDAFKSIGDEDVFVEACNFRRRVIAEKIDLSAFDDTTGILDSKRLTTEKAK